MWLAGRGWSAGPQLVDRGPCVAGVPGAVVRRSRRLAFGGLARAGYWNGESAHRRPAARVHWNARVRQPLCTILRRLYRANLLARVCRARSASECAAVRTSHVNMRCPKRQARLVSERLIHKLALRPSQHCITNLIDVEMTGRTSTKVTQFLIQRWKIVNDSVF